MSPKARKFSLIAGTVCLTVYLLSVCAWSRSQASRQLCAGLDGGSVTVIDPAGVGFVNADSLTAELMPILGNLTSRRLAELNLGAMRDYIAGLDKIEHAEVIRLNNNKLRINVTPMLPVARVWPDKGHSYYVNREGKHIAASHRYRVDVPQLSGSLPEGTSPAAFLPLLDYLNAHSDMKRMITMISVADSSNIILVPAVRGHVINLGDASAIDDKFERLRVFYREVLPVKGWDCYDTISLKWNNQIVATRRHNKLPNLTIPIIEELEDETDDLETMEIGENQTYTVENT